MATYTPVTKVIGSTGASGATSYGNMKAAQDALIVTAVATAVALTGYQPQSAVVSPCLIISDSVSSIYIMQQTLSYTIVT